MVPRRRLEVRNLHMWPWSCTCQNTMYLVQVPLIWPLWSYKILVTRWFIKGCMNNPRLLTLLIAHRIWFCCQKMCTYISRERQNMHSGDKWGNSHISSITKVSNFWVVSKVHFVKKIKSSVQSAHIMRTWLQFLKYMHFISRNAHRISSVRTAKLAVWEQS